jgi:hypothetical protein
MYCVSPLRSVCFPQCSGVSATRSSSSSSSSSKTARQRCVFFDSLREERCCYERRVRNNSVHRQHSNSSNLCHQFDRLLVPKWFTVCTMRTTAAEHRQQHSCTHPLPHATGSNTELLSCACDCCYVYVFIDAVALDLQDL